MDIPDGGHAVAAFRGAQCHAQTDGRWRDLSHRRARGRRALRAHRPLSATPDEMRQRRGALRKSGHAGPTPARRWRAESFDPPPRPGRQARPPARWTTAEQHPTGGQARGRRADRPSSSMGEAARRRGGARRRAGPNRGDGRAADVIRRPRPPTPFLSRGPRTRRPAKPQPVGGALGRPPDDRAPPIPSALAQRSARLTAR